MGDPSPPASSPPASGPPPLPPHPDEQAAAIAARVQAEVAQEYRLRGEAATTPEARREIAQLTEARQRARGVWRRNMARVAPGTRPFEIAKRVAIGTYTDGFIHAGNLAYLALIALFPFLILTTAMIGALGSSADGEAAIRAILSNVPPPVAATLDGPLHEVMKARTGIFLWLGALVALWTVGSLIETIRDILRRAYGTHFQQSFWAYRLYSIGIIVGAVLLLMLSFSAGTLVTFIMEIVARILPDRFDHAGALIMSRIVSAIGLFGALYLLFLTLTPETYRKWRYPKWPGALVTTLWWTATMLALPPLLASFLAYDLTYGSLAGVMVALFFFYLVGLGVVIGAELNAALVEPNGHDDVGQHDDRARVEAQRETDRAGETQA